jgi:prepilin signal peptidase PulO-like enzyme (type II secretory pathway)
MLAETIVPLFLFLIGLVVGSFLNVVVMRLHEGRDFVKGRSGCDHCGHTLVWWEMVPVISWLLLRGRCRHCKRRLSVQHPAVELLTGGLFVLSYLTHPPQTYGDVLSLALWLYAAASLIILAVYDLRWYLLPDKVLLPIMIPAIAILIGDAVSARSLEALWKPLAAAAIFGGAFYAIAAVSKGKWMGGGDIKLAFIMGLLLGLKKTALAMLVAFNLAAIVGVALIMMRRKQRSDVIPFGPFLILGTFIAYLFGQPLVDWYVAASGLNLLYP